MWKKNVRMWAELRTCLVACFHTFDRHKYRRGCNLGPGGELALEEAGWSPSTFCHTVSEPTTAACCNAVRVKWVGLGKVRQMCKNSVVWVKPCRYTVRWKVRQAYAKQDSLLKWVSLRAIFYEHLVLHRYTKLIGHGNKGIQTAHMKISLRQASAT